MRSNLSPLDSILVKVVNNRDAYRRIQLSPYAAELGDQIACGRCQQLVTCTATTNAAGHTLRYWSECGCIVQAVDRAAQYSAASNAAHAALRDATPTDTRYDRFTFDTFDPTRLPGGAQLLAAAQRWASQVPHMPVADYRAAAAPRPCLYFYSAGKGRGKTHLAAATANAIKAQGRRVAIVDEISYIERYWATPLEQRDRVSAGPAEQAHVTLIDDLGQRESTTAGLRDAWYDVINPRWLNCGWLLITSNHTPEELVERGTISAACYSRIVQMTRGQLVTFAGADQRVPLTTTQEPLR